MQPPRKTPLSHQDLQKLHAAVAALGEAEDVARRATDCGYDCRAHLAAIAEMRQRAQKIAQHFGGGISPA